MHQQKNTLLMPGNYLFRANPFEPWTNVTVFRKRVHDQDLLKARWIGGEIDVAKLAQHGEWKSRIAR